MAKTVFTMKSDMRSARQKMRRAGHSCLLPASIISHPGTGAKHGLGGRLHNEEHWAIWGNGLRTGD
jgi:hypothetical protein